MLLKRPGSPEVLRVLTSTYAVNRQPDDAAKIPFRLGASPGNDDEILEVSEGPIPSRGITRRLAERRERPRLRMFRREQS